MIFTLLILLVSTACSVGPPYYDPEIEIPRGWKGGGRESCSIPEEELEYLDYWWEVFQDPKLDELETVAVENNRDLFVAMERVKEAKALMGIAAADFYPQLTLNPLFTSTGILNKNFSNPALANNPIVANDPALSLLANNNIFREHQMLYFLPADLNYEVDLWGKIRDRYQSAAYNFEAQQQDYEAVMLSLTSQLAITYFQLRTLDHQLELLAKVIKTREKAYTINKDRYEEQIAMYADVTLAGQELESVKNQQQEFRRQRAIAENTLALLLGLPASEFTLENSPLQGLPPSIPAGIPSEMLLRRPDVAEAEFRVRSEHAMVKNAYSQFFPSLTLTASTGFLSPIAKDFLHWLSRYWMNGFQIDQVLFDGGRLDNNLKRQIARFLEAGGNYQNQVLIAFQEVEDSLTNVESYAKQFEIITHAVEWAQKTYDIYSDRYRLGLIYYINVADAEQALLNFQIQWVSLQGLRYASTVQLVKALGGGWSQSF